MNRFQADAFGTLIDCDLFIWKPKSGCSEDKSTGNRLRLNMRLSTWDYQLKRGDAEVCSLKIDFEHVLFMCIRSNGKWRETFSSPHGALVRTSDLEAWWLKSFENTRSWQDKQFMLQLGCLPNDCHDRRAISPRYTTKRICSLARWANCWLNNVGGNWLFAPVAQGQSFV